MAIRRGLAMRKKTPKSTQFGATPAPIRGGAPTAPLMGMMQGMGGAPVPPAAPTTVRKAPRRRTRGAKGGY